MRRELRAVTYDFWGERVRVTSHPSDESDLAFFYGHHETDDNGSVNIEVEIECLDWPGRGFFRSLLTKDGLRKRVTSRLVDGISLQTKETYVFTSWSKAPSPLPPFNSPRFRSRFASISGAAFVTSRGRLTLLLGANYVGKTATLLALADAGCTLVSDGIVLFDLESEGVVAYHSTVGLRGRTLLESSERFDALDHRETVSPVTGLVILVRQADLIRPYDGPPRRVDEVIALTRRPVERPRAVPVVTPELPWFPAENAIPARSMLPTTTRWLDVPLDHSPADVSRLILGDD